VGVVFKAKERLTSASNVHQLPRSQLVMTAKISSKTARLGADEIENAFANLPSGFWQGVFNQSFAKATSDRNECLTQTGKLHKAAS
jgi:hypothetical protein